MIDFCFDYLTVAELAYLYDCGARARANMTFDISAVLAIANKCTNTDLYSLPAKDFNAVYAQFVNAFVEWEKESNNA